MPSRYPPLWAEVTADSGRDALRVDARKLSRHGTVAEQTALEEDRQSLETKIKGFHSKLETMVEGIEHGFQPSGEDDATSDVADLVGRNAQMPEHMYIFMPSSLRRADIERLGLETIARQELELRQGQANDALEGLKLALGHKALLYRNKVRDVPLKDS